jgi:hypothetical protein
MATKFFIIISMLLLAFLLVLGCDWLVYDIMALYFKLKR